MEWALRQLLSWVPPTRPRVSPVVDPPPPPVMPSGPGPGEDVGWITDDDTAAACRRLFDLHYPQPASRDAATSALTAPRSVP